MNLSDPLAPSPECKTTGHHFVPVRPDDHAGKDTDWHDYHCVRCGRLVKLKLEPVPPGYKPVPE